VALFGGSASSSLINLLIGFFVLRFLSAEEYGRYAVVVDFVNMVAIITGSLFTNALQRYVAFYRMARDSQDTYLRGIVKLAFGYGGTISLLVAAILFLGADVISKRLLGNVAYSPYLRLYSLSVPFMVLSTYLSAYLKGIGKFLRVGILDQGMPSLVRAAVVLVGLPNFPGYGPVIVTLSLVAKFVSNFVFNLLAAFASLRAVLVGKSRWRLKEWILYSLPIWGRYALSITASNVKSVLVGSLQSAMAGGQFKVAFLILSPVYMLETSLVNVLYTTVSGRVAKGENVISEIKERTFQLSITEALLGSLLLLIGPPILGFFGKGYEGASSLLLLVLLGYLINSTSSLHRVFFMADGDSSKVFIVHGVGAFSSIIFGYFLIKAMGSVGGAWAFLAETTSSSFLTHILFWRKTGHFPLGKRALVLLLLFWASALFLLVRGV